MIATASRFGRYIALAAALLGWMFDGLETGLFPLVARPALQELLPGVNEATIGQWYSVITAGFLVGAATGGVLFGWLGDKIGRVKAMTASVIVYAVCSGVCAGAQTPWQLAVLRFIGALGMGGEWALGVALVMELWPSQGRGWLAGWIGAFGNFGYGIVGAVSYGLASAGNDLPDLLASIGIPSELAAALTANGNWRLLMLVGAIPALLTLFIQFFVPESEKWLREKAAGTASRWSERDLIGLLVGAAAGAGIIYLWADNDISYPVRIAGTVVGLGIITVGYLQPMRGYLSRSSMSVVERRQILRRMLLAAGISGVPLLATWSGVMWQYNYVDALTKDPQTGKSLDDFARPKTMIASALGAALGCVLAAVFGDRFGRRPVYAAMCLLSMGVMFGFFRFNTHFGWEFVASAALLGCLSASFYGWIPLYLPELFPTRVRATGQGFGYNFGRVIAAIGTLQTATLQKAFQGDYSKACSMIAGIYVVGLILIAFAPETKGKPLPE